MTCQQCGNDFHRGEISKRDGKEYIKCPYCGYYHRRKYNNKKRGTK